MMVRNGCFLIVLLLLCRMAIAGGPRYELTAGEKLPPSGYGYGTTTYTFYEVSGGAKKLKWRRTEPSTYIAHWISPSGRVWLMTGAAPSKNGFIESTKSPLRDASAITLRDTTGDTLRTWNGWTTSRRGPYTGPPSTMLKSDIPAGTTSYLKGNAEQILLQGKTGRGARLTVYWPKNETRPVLEVHEFDAKHPSPLSFAERAFASAGYDVPEFEPIAPRINLALWSAGSADGHADLVWLASAYGDMGIPVTSGQGEPLARRPDSIQWIPMGRLLLFDFADRTATMSFRDNTGRLLRSIDLLALGGFSSVTEAKTNLKWRAPLMQSQHGWVPVGQIQSYEAIGASQIELWDTKGRRFLIDLHTANRPTKPGRISTQKSPDRVYSGLLARRPKDPYTSPTWQKTEERYVHSPNKRFSLRYRRFALRNSMGPRSITMLAHVMENGKTVDVEMWNRTTYSDVPFMGVTDGGRSVLLEVGRTKAYMQNDRVGHMQDAATMLEYGPDGAQTGGEDPLEGWGLKTAENLRKRVIFASIKLEVLGKPEAGQTDGIPTPMWPAERITIPIKGMASKVFYLVRHTGMGENLFVNDQPWVRSIVQALARK